MAYQKTTWVDGVTPLNAENMNHIEDGIEAAGQSAGLLNIENGLGNYSLQQKADVETEHVKGGLALGDNSAAFGLGDTYDMQVSISNKSLVLTSGSGNPNWQNMVCKLGNEYRRVVAVVNNAFEVDTAFSQTSGTATVSIITQVAKGNNSFVWGEYSQAHGEASFAGGIACKAIGDGSFAGGYFTVANQARSFAFGDHVIAAALDQVVFGKYNEVNFNALLIVGNGEGAGHEVNALELFTDSLNINVPTTINSLLKVNGNSGIQVSSVGSDSKCVPNKQYLADNYAPKLSGSPVNVVYTLNSLSEPEAKVYSTSATAGTIPMRTSNGRLSVGTPQADSDAATKKYVDDNSTNVGLEKGSSTHTTQFKNSMSAGYAIRLGNCMDSDRTKALIDQVTPTASWVGKTIRLYNVIEGGGYDPTGYVEATIIAINEPNMSWNIQIDRDYLGTGYIQFGIGIPGDLIDIDYDYYVNLAKSGLITNGNQLVIGKYNESGLAYENALFIIGNGTSSYNTSRSNAFVVFNDGHAILKTVGVSIDSVVTKGYVDERVPWFHNIQFRGFLNGSDYMTFNWIVALPRQAAFASGTELETYLKDKYSIPSTVTNPIFLACIGFQNNESLYIGFVSTGLRVFRVSSNGTINRSIILANGFVDTVKAA